MKTFGEMISEPRKERGLTQKALASQVKKKDGIAIGIAYINDIKHDRRNPRSPDFVAQLAAVLGVPLEGPERSWLGARLKMTSKKRM